MAKIIIGFWLVGFLFLGSISGFSQAVVSSKRNAVIAVYKSQIGVREKTGNNDGAAVEVYLRTVGLDKGYAWCAAFVKWCLVKGGVLQAAAINGMAASCQRKESLVFYQNRWQEQPLQADVFCLYYKSLGRIGHTGFFDGWANRSMGTYYAVEGNTNGGGSRDGDGVYRRIRQVAATHSISRWVL